MRTLFISSLLCCMVPALAETADVTTPPALEATQNAAAQVIVRPIRIGVVDVRTVVQKSDQLEAINTALTKKFKPREAAIVEAQAALKGEQDKLSKEGASLSDSDRSKLEHKVIDDRAHLQAMITSFQQDLDNEQNSSMQKLLGQVANIVNTMAKSEHYDLIIQGDSVPYVTDQLNITDKVLDALNNASS